MNIAIVGLGLIGGSLAKAIQRKKTHTVWGCDRSPYAETQALAEGAIDGVIQGDFSKAELTVIAVFPGAAVDFLRENRGAFRPGSTVVDLCGVKRFVCAEAEELLRDTGVTFIGGHPMAGRECFGYENATAELFDGASMILTPTDSTPKDKLEAVSDFFRWVGFGHIQLTTDARHDEIIAYTSQLAHIVSSAYIKSPTAREYMGFSAGSFKDLTRVAKLNEDMWSELFLHNRDYLCNQIGVIIENLEDFRNALEAVDGGALRDMLREGRELKEKFDSEERTRKC